MHRVIIIGAGPAGISAAIQLKRQGINPLLLEKDKVGGLLWNANLVENYPGFPAGISGPKLVSLFVKQMDRIGVEVVYEEVIRLDLVNEIFQVETNKNNYQTRFIVASTGTRSVKLPLEINSSLRSRVFTEVWPLLSQRDKHITIIGAGDAAFDYALNLSKQNEVTILNRGDTLKCLPLLYERSKMVKSVRYLENTEVKEILHGGIESPLQLKCKNITGGFSLDSDYVIFAIGRVPQLDYVTGRTAPTVKNDKIYFIGDVMNGLFRQTAIAAGDGIRAAMSIYQSLPQRTMEDLQR